MFVVVAGAKMALPFNLHLRFGVDCMPCYWNLLLRYLEEVVSLSNTLLIKHPKRNVDILVSNVKTDFVIIGRGAGGFKNYPYRTPCCFRSTGTAKKSGGQNNNMRQMLTSSETRDIAFQCTTEAMHRFYRVMIDGGKSEIKSLCNNIMCHLLPLTDDWVRQSHPHSTLRFIRLRFLPIIGVIDRMTTTSAIQINFQMTRWSPVKKDLSNSISSPSHGFYGIVLGKATDCLS